MSVSFVARKCTQCAGRLQYIKEKKVWQCLYCGAEIEKQEQYDGLFTIKNVVRQSLLETSFRRLDNAAKNLVECEKIDSRYVGTLIAKITYEMICMITPGACSERDARNLFAQMKKNYDLLQENSKTVSEEEEELYEFLDEADIFATLVLVYDSLEDQVRRDYVIQLIDAKEIYSKDANGNLLAYALKKGKLELADEILRNTHNINVSAALSEVLQKYPDTGAKGEHIANLIAAGELGYEDKSSIKNYLATSQDSIAAKTIVIESAVTHGLDVSLEFVVHNILPMAEQEKILSVLRAYCSRKLGDADVLCILDYACTCKDAKTAVEILDCLKQGDQYVFVPSKSVIAMLSESTLAAPDKMAILEKLLEFKMEAKGIEAVMTNYLCYNQDPVSVRKVMIPYLADKISMLPTSTVQNYVLKCAVDGTEKPDIVKLLFDKGLNISFFNELLSAYMNESADSSEVRLEIMELLLEKGLKVTPSTLIEYICGAQDDTPMKIRFIKKLISNGVQIWGNVANAYLEKIDPEQFSSELFSLLVTPASTFGAEAATRYLLHCRDREAVKAQNFCMIAESCSQELRTRVCKVKHLGNEVSCSVLQAYVLISADAKAVTCEIVKWLTAKQKMKLNPEITVSGKTMKFKKYAADNKSELSEITNSICEEYRVYSIWF